MGPLEEIALKGLGRVREPDGFAGERAFDGEIRASDFDRIFTRAGRDRGPMCRGGLQYRFDQLRQDQRPDGVMYGDPIVTRGNRAESFSNRLRTGVAAG